MTNTQKISSIIFTIIAVLSVVFFGFYFLGGSVPETIGTQFEAKNFTSLVLVWAVVLFIIALEITLLYSLYNAFPEPKLTKVFLYGVLGGNVLIAVGILSIKLWFLTILGFLVLPLAILIFEVVNIIYYPKILIKNLVQIGLFAVLYLVSYLLASSEPLTILSPDVAIPTEATLKMVGTGLNATYILAIVAFVGIIASEVMRAFK